MKTLPNWLLISGSGRNVGKTTLSCRIIREMADLKPIAVKISSHLHPLPENSEWIVRRDDFSVIRETIISSKDSSKMLKAGAETVYYAQGPDICLPEILRTLELFTANRPVICESGGLRKLMVPGVYLLIKGDAGATKPGIENLLDLADVILTPSDVNEWRLEKKLSYYKNNWQLNL